MIFHPQAAVSTHPQNRWGMTIYDSFDPIDPPASLKEQAGQHTSSAPSFRNFAKRLSRSEPRGANHDKPWREQATSVELPHTIRDSHVEPRAFFL